MHAIPTRTGSGSSCRKKPAADYDAGSMPGCVSYHARYCMYQILTVGVATKGALHMVAQPMASVPAAHW